MPHRNQYALLELPLGKDKTEKDLNAIFAAMDKKIAEWNKNSDDNVIKKLKNKITEEPLKFEGDKFPSLQGKTFQAVVKACCSGKATDLDAVRLKKEFEQLLDKMAKEALADAMHRIEDLMRGPKARGYITTNEITNLAKTQPGLTEEIIRQHVKDINLAVKDTAVMATPPEKPKKVKAYTPMLKVNFDVIVNSLLVFQAKDIYDAPILDCPCNASLEVLNERCKAFKGKSIGKSTSPESVAKKNLIPFLEKIVATKEARDNFDRQWVAEKLTQELLGRFAIMDFSKETYLNAIDMCRVAGMEKDEAEYFVYDYFCKKNKKPFPLQEPAEPKKSCPSCRSLNPLGAKRCAKCSTYLQVSCPKCETICDTAFQIYCTCGFGIGNLPLVSTELDKARTALNCGDLIAAGKHIRSALLIWPDCPDALALQKILEEARSAHIEEQKRKYLRLLTVPTGIRAVANAAGTISLEWQSSHFKIDPQPKDVEISYLVVRKENGPPSGVSDGTRLKIIAMTSFVDSTPVPGQPYGYAVFACCSGVPMATGAVSAIIMTVVEPEISEVVPGDGKVRLSWRLPEKSFGAALCRKKGTAPSSERDGEALNVNPGATKFDDKGLNNGVLYGYFLQALYRDANGKVVKSNGVAVTATPKALPPMVQDFACSLTAAGVGMSWKAMPAHEVRIFLSKDPLGEAGTFLPLDGKAFSGATEVKVTNPSQGTTLYKGGDETGLYATPVVCDSQNGLLCPAVFVVMVKSVSSLSVSKISGDLVVKWDWPDGCDETVVVFRPDTYPENHLDPKATILRYFRNEYKVSGGCKVSSSGTEDKFFAVYAISRKDGKTWASNPAHVSWGAVRTVITYELVAKKKFVFFGPASYHLSIQSAGKAPLLPPLVVVMKRGGQPLSRNDGSVVAMLPEQCGKDMTYPIPLHAAQKGVHFKLFLDGATDSGAYEVRHPPSSKMSV